MGIVMRCMAASDPYDHEGNRPPIGCFLKRYDAEAFDGRGLSEFTIHLDQALVFDSVADAVRCWQTVPANRPVREDGKPNRPLTAMTMEFLTVEMARGTQT